MATKIIKTTCSGGRGCREDVVLDLEQGTATVHVASNGRRGSLHVPDHDVVADLTEEGPLLLWDCPACGHADSYDLDEEA